jgi:hypothetical protein
MSEPSRQPGPPARACLASCLREVNVARARLRATRNDLRSWEKPALRADLLAALEGYAEAITDLGAPVPRRLLAEIELYRRLRNRT